MLQTRKEKIIFGVIIALLILIPTGTFVLSQRANFSGNKPSSSQKTQSASSSAKEVPKLTPLQELQNKLNDDGSITDAVSAPQVSFGPTLNFKLVIEGRPKDNYAAKIFVGIASGSPTNNPQYLLSFTIDLPATGIYTGLSLAGLNQSETYSAYIKGPTQLATASAFVVKPTAADLGTLNLISGDLNDDNVINTQDYSIAKTASGSKPGFQKWNPIVDFNLDNFINSFDLGIISKNLGKTGLSGAWFSPPPPTTPSAIFVNPSIGSPSNSSDSATPTSGGYWMWIPKID